MARHPGGWSSGVQCRPCRSPGEQAWLESPPPRGCVALGKSPPFWFLVFILVKMGSLTPCPASLLKLLEDQVRLYMR